MVQYINIGFNNSVNTNKIVAVLYSETLPARKLVQIKKQEGMLLDCTCGRKTKSVIVTSEGLVLLSILAPATLTMRLNENNKPKNNE